MSSIQSLAEGVVCGTLGVSRASLSDALKAAGEGKGSRVVGIDITLIIMLIDAIVAAVMRIMDNCPAPEAKVIAAVKKPTLIQRARAKATIADYCDVCGGWFWRRRAFQIAERVCRDAAAMSDDALATAIAEVRGGMFADATDAAE